MTLVAMGDGMTKVADPDSLPARNKFDFYPTPWSVIEYALELEVVQRSADSGGRVADIGAGSGRWGTVMKSVNPEQKIYGFEKQNIPNPNPTAYHGWIVGDVLKTIHQADGMGFKAIIGNPPFYLLNKRNVTPLFHKLFNYLEYGGVVVFFARLAALCSRERWLRIYSPWAPSEVHIFSGRVSFYPEGHPRCGASKNVEHALLVWRKDEFGRIGDRTSLIWAPPLPNDNKYEGQFKGQNTWQDMIGLGLEVES